MNKSLILKIYALLSFSAIFAATITEQYNDVVKRRRERKLGYSFFMMGLERGSTIPQDIMGQIASYLEPTENTSIIFNPDVLIIPKSPDDNKIIKKLDEANVSNEVKTLVLFFCYKKPGFKEKILELLKPNATPLGAYSNRDLNNIMKGLVQKSFDPNPIADYAIEALFGTSNPGFSQTVWYIIKQVQERGAGNLLDIFRLEPLKRQVREIRDREQAFFPLISLNGNRNTLALTQQFVNRMTTSFKRVGDAVVYPALALSVGSVASLYGWMVKQTLDNALAGSENEIFFSRALVAESLMVPVLIGLGASAIKKALNRYNRFVVTGL